MSLNRTTGLKNIKEMSFNNKMHLHELDPTILNLNQMVCHNTIGWGYSLC